MRLQPFSKYKSSGVKWCPELPSSWKISTVKRVAKFTTGWTPQSGNADFYGDDYFWANISDIGPKVLNETSKSISQLAIDTFHIESSKPGDLLFSFKLSIGRVSFVGQEMFTNEAIATFKKNQDYDIRWAFYAFPKFIPENAEENIYGAPLLNQERIKNAKLFLPPIDEQKSIANLLDRETAKIDELIQKQVELIQELNLKRLSEISHVVTRGLNQTINFSSCENLWLDKIPSHWEFKKLKHIAKIFASNVDKKTVEGQKSIQLCNYTDVYYNETITSDLVFMNASATDGQISKFALKANDVIITKDSETPDDIGIASFVPNNIPNVICGYHLSIIRPYENISGAFIKRLFDSSYVKSSWMILANGVTRYGLSQYAIDNLKIPVPPYTEQIEIVEYLDDLTRKIDLLIEKSKSSIALLKQHRESLISAAVTGKIDVRELV